MKRYLLLVLILALALTITTISCFGGGSSSGDDDDDDDNDDDDHSLEDCLAMIQDMSMCLVEVSETFPCGLSDGNDLLEACQGESSNIELICMSNCGFDEPICQDMVDCMKDCCGEGDDDDDDDDDIFDDDDDDDDDIFPDDDDDDDDDDDECSGNTAPTFEDAVWIVGDTQVIYPSYASASIADIVGVGFVWADAECNLIGGYGTVTLTVDGVEEAPQEMGPYTDAIGCSTDQSSQLIGFFFSSPLPAGTYDWVFTATDICDATSYSQTGTFYITN